MFVNIGGDGALEEYANHSHFMVGNQMKIEFNQPAPSAEDLHKLSNQLRINTAIRVGVFIVWVAMTFGIAVYTDIAAVKFLFFLLGTWGSFTTHLISDPLIERFLPVPRLQIAGATFYSPEDSSPTDILESELDDYVFKAPKLEPYIQSVKCLGRPFILAEKTMLCHIAIAEQNKL